MENCARKNHTADTASGITKTNTTRTTAALNTRATTTRHAVISMITNPLVTLSGSSAPMANTARKSAMANIRASLKRNFPSVTSLVSSAVNITSGTVCRASAEKASAVDDDRNWVQRPNIAVMAANGVRRTKLANKNPGTESSFAAVFTSPGVSITAIHAVIRRTRSA
ncbi:hypothetical protein FJT64_027094 [Amphibalanus amphitrite]|uniref:Uncharacterized protein n=1 Tax=Amphibalanus amphitrite TaxID=1232801 RepID=A0A6A4WBW1_AMPAM|nr:hypothetical protein FJT64_027094 [Amphibalanus amphitrite]KAF0300383.1 hypothetical protein FJT64_027094 [Amphibalanus amphitrite]